MYIILKIHFNPNRYVCLEKITISLKDDKAKGLHLAQRAAQEALDKGALKLIESAENEKYS